eukprot:10794225-Alexandrium_andersonii.AAC.1
MPRTSPARGHTSRGRVRLLALRWRGRVFSSGRRHPRPGGARAAVCLEGGLASCRGPQPQP